MSELKPLLDRLDSIERKVEVSARGLLPAIALIETAAKGVGVVIKKMDEGEAKDLEEEEKAYAKEEEEGEKEGKSPKVFEYLKDGRLKSVKKGECSARIIWNDDGSVRSIVTA